MSNPSEKGKFSHGMGPEKGPLHWICLWHQPYRHQRVSISSPTRPLHKRRTAAYLPWCLEKDRPYSIGSMGLLGIENSYLPSLRFSLGLHLGFESVVRSFLAVTLLLLVFHWFCFIHGTSLHCASLPSKIKSKILELQLLIFTFWDRMLVVLPLPWSKPWTSEKTCKAGSGVGTKARYCWVCAR